MFEQKTRPEITKEVAEVRQIKSKKFVGSLKLHPGQKLYECNLSSGSIVPASYESATATISGKITRVVTTKQDCVYVPAINERNAFKKIAKLLK